MCAIEVALLARPRLRSRAGVRAAPPVATARRRRAHHRPVKPRPPDPIAQDADVQPRPDRRRARRCNDSSSPARAPRSAPRSSSSATRASSSTAWSATRSARRPTTASATRSSGSPASRPTGSRAMPTSFRCAASGRRSASRPSTAAKSRPPAPTARSRSSNSRPSWSTACWSTSRSRPTSSKAASAASSSCARCKPLDYGKRRIQFEIRGDFQPKDDDVYQHDGLGYRANSPTPTSSTPGIGDIGISIGYQRQDTTAPEDYYNANATFQLCNTCANNPSLVTGTAAALDRGGRGRELHVRDRPALGRAGDRCDAGRGRRDARRLLFRQLVAQLPHPADRRKCATPDRRDPVAADARTSRSSIDGQYSNRASLEDRNVLQITEGLRGVQPLIIGNGTNGYSTAR